MPGKNEYICDKFENKWENEKETPLPINLNENN